MGYPLLAIPGYKTNLFFTFARDVRTLCQRVCPSRAIFIIICPYSSSDFFPGRCLYLLLLYMPLSKGKTCLQQKKNRCIFLLLAYSNLNIFSMSHSKLMTYVLPLSPSVALLTVSLSRWEIEGKLGKRHLWVLWPALIVSVMTPIALVFTMHKWIPAKHGLSTIHIAIPNYYSFNWDTDSII